LVIFGVLIKDIKTIKEKQGNLFIQKDVGVLCIKIKKSKDDLKFRNSIFH